MQRRRRPKTAKAMHVNAKDVAERAAIDPPVRDGCGSPGSQAAASGLQGGKAMNRKDIAGRVAGETGIARQDSEAAVGVVFASIAEALARGEDVAVAGFGSFARKERPARQGRHPRTGESISIGPSSGVSFRAGKALKDALNR